METIRFRALGGRRCGTGSGGWRPEQPEGLPLDRPYWDVLRRHDTMRDEERLPRRSARLLDGDVGMRRIVR